jgi:hypothetical protein
VHSNDNAILMDNIEVDDDHLMLTNPDTKNLLSTCMNKQMKPFKLRRHEPVTEPNPTNSWLTISHNNMMGLQHT